MKLTARCRSAAAELRVMCTLATTLAVLLATLACYGRVTPSTAPQAVVGRWLLTFRIMGGLFRTPVEFFADSVGMLQVVALGPALVQFERASVEKGVLRLEVLPALVGCTSAGT